MIAVAGSRHGGNNPLLWDWRHICKKCGMSAVYEEFNESGAVRPVASVVEPGQIHVVCFCI